VGTDYGIAKAHLAATGFVIHTQGGVRGTVKSQNPVAGTHAAKGSTITVVFEVKPSGELAGIRRLVHDDGRE
jgi:hypothetical protein